MFRRWGIALALAGSVLIPTASFSADYTLTKLPLLKGLDYCEATAVNDVGRAVGWCWDQANTVYKAFSWNPVTNKISTLKELAGGSIESVAWDINSTGQAVGYSVSAKDQQAVAWDPVRGLVVAPWIKNGIQPLEARSVNDSGLAVGFGRYGNNFASYAWNINTGTIVVGPAWFQPYAINAAGQVAGYEDFGVGTAQPCIWDTTDNSLTYIGTLNSEPQAYALGINASGQAVGYVYHLSSGAREGFLYDPGATQGVVSLGFLPGQVDSWSSAINDAGLVVGRSGDFPFTWDSANGIVQLQFSDGSSDGMSFITPDAVNNNAVIVGHAYNTARGAWDAVYMTPRP